MNRYKPKFKAGDKIWYALEYARSHVLFIQRIAQVRKIKYYEFTDINGEMRWPVECLIFDNRAKLMADVEVIWQKVLNEQ